LKAQSARVAECEPADRDAFDLAGSGSRSRSIHTGNAATLAVDER
jgi:hypothetical protein